MSQTSRHPLKRLALTTGGGDAPGLNAVIRAATQSALNRGLEVVGIRDGYCGIIAGEPCIPLVRETVRSIAGLGGTILGTTNCANPFEFRTHFPGSTRRALAAEIVVSELKRQKIDGVIAIGGDGSMSIAYRLYRMGVQVIGVPKTIDNDLLGTERTFGFDTAVATATDCIDKLQTTAQAHGRTMVIEVMGRHAGWIALHAGISASADVILIPEIPYTMKNVAAFLNERRKSGRASAIVVVAEGAREREGAEILQKKTVKGHEPLLGGAGQYVATQIEQRTGADTRALVLGHIQRGGSPTTYDRLLGLRYGTAAVRLAEAGRWGQMVSFQPPGMTSTSLESTIGGRKCVDVNSDTVLTARELGICLGD